MSEVILLDGGLDTASSPLAAKRGGLRACQNYEVGTERGYRRMDGIEIYDGTINPLINNWLRITFRSECADGAFDSGVIDQPIVFPNPYGYLGESIVRGFSQESIGESSIYTLDVELSQNTTVSLSPKTFTADGINVAPFEEFDVIYSLGPARLQSDVNVDNIQPIRYPDLSRTQRIAGLFWRNDKLYAIVDCVKITVIKAKDNTIDVIDNPITDGVYLYANGNTDPFGEVLFGDKESITYVPKIAAAPQVGDTIVVGADLEDIPVLVEYTLLSFERSDAAVLWVATHGGTDGWERVETGRVASYKQTIDCDDASFFASYNRFAFDDTVINDVITSPEFFADSATADETYWSNPDNVTADDALVTEYGWDTAADIGPDGPYHYWAALQASSTSTMLKCKFDFSSIPRTARIVGVQVIINKRKNPNIYGVLGADTGVPSIIFDDKITMSWNGFESENKADTANWQTGFVESTYGGDQDMWGSNVSVTDLISQDFSVNISARNGTAIRTFRAFEIDYVKVIVYYIKQSNDVYIYRADVLPGDGIDRRVVVPHRTIQSGLVSLKEARGQIVIERPIEDGAIGLDKNSDGDGNLRGYITAPGDELRTAAAHGGQLIAVLTTADGPQYLPSSWVLEDTNKRWHMNRASPYAQDNTDISILCNGVGPAHIWDDRNLLPIATRVDAKYEKPTFSAYFANSLVLAYDTGTVTFSDTGDPLAFEGGAAGAISTEISDKITGMLPLKGEALGIFTENTIQALYGDSTASLAQKTISPNSGAIAYTVCDMGVPVFTDFRGIGTVDAVQEYGDFQRGRWSFNIQNYITPIIQDESKFLGDPARVICAYPVRNKNQYRLCFSDASVITMTLVGSGLEQQFTTQSIFTRTNEGDKAMMPLLALEHGVSSAGRDVIFCSLNSGFHDGYVFRIDQGNKFPSIYGDTEGSEIEAYIDINFNHSLDRPSSTSRIDRLAVYGVCKGYATLGINQSVFYGDPGAYTVTFTAGDILATADKPAKYFMSSIDIGCEARDISYRISSNELEASHTLQAIEVFQTIDGQRKDDKR